MKTKIDELKKECTHNWKAVYFRKKEGEGPEQKWIKAKDYLICDLCLKVVKREVKEVGRK